MKTIKQIADEIGVTKQAVQKRIAREPLCTHLSPYISTQGGTKYIDETGEIIVKSAFNDMSIDKGVDSSIPMSMDKGIDVHMDTKTESTNISSLLAIVGEQQKTIQDLTAANRELTAAIENTTTALRAAQALHAGTMRQQLTDGSEGDQPQPAESTGNEKKSIWKRILRK